MTSVIQTTLFMGKPHRSFCSTILGVHSFAINCQLLFLNHWRNIDVEIFS